MIEKSRMCISEEFKVRYKCDYISNLTLIEVSPLDAATRLTGVSMEQVAETGRDDSLASLQPTCHYFLIKYLKVKIGQIMPIDAHV